MTKERRDELLSVSVWPDGVPMADDMDVMREDFHVERIRPLTWGELRELLQQCPCEQRQAVETETKGA